MLRLLILGLLLLPAAGRAQSAVKVVDSLRARLATLPPLDTSRVLVLDELCWQLSSSDLSQATAYGRQGLRLARRLGYRRGLLKCLIDLGNCASYASDFPAGTRYFLEALRRARQPPQQLTVMGFAYNGLANLHIDQQEYAEAQQRLLQALALTRQTHSLADAALFGSNLGQVLRLREQYAEAGVQLRRALARYRELGQRTGQAHCLEQLGLLALEQQQLPLARAYAQRALALSRALGHDYYVASNLHLLASIALKSQRAAAAEAAARQSLRYARRLGSRTLVVDNYRMLALAEEQRGRYQPAYRWQQRFHQAHDSLLGDEKTAEVARLRVRYDTDQKEARIRELQQLAQLHELRAAQQRSQLLAVLLGAALLALALAGGLWYFYQRRRLERVRAEERLRTRIATDLHDDVGTLLTRVTMQAELLHDVQPSPALNRLLTNSRAAARTMRDVVWSIDAQADTVGALTDRMRDYLDQLPAALSTALCLSDDVDPAVPLAQEQRQHMYLVFKEAVGNALRHARAATCLCVTLRRQPHTLVLEITDDGHQDPAAPVGRSGLGLRSMARRAAALHGYLEAGPLPGSGFQVRLAIPFPASGQ